MRRSGLAVIGGNAGATIAARLASALLSTVVIAALARAWSLEALGSYLLAFGWFQALTPIPLLGLSHLLARDVAAGAAAPARLAASASALALSLGAALAFAMTLAARLAPPALAGPLALLGLALLPTAAIGVAEAVLTGQERLARVAAIGLGENLGRAALAFVLLAAGGGPAALCAGILGLRLAALAAYLLAPALWAALRPDRARLATVRGLLRSAPVMGGGVLLSSAFARLDLLLLGALLPAAQIAPYSVAARVYDLALMLPTVLAAALLPAATRLARDRSAALAGFCALLLRYGLLLGAAAALAGGLLAAPLIAVLFGAGFADAAPCLRLLLLAAVVTGANQVFAGLFLVRGRPALDLPCLAAGCVALAAGVAVLPPLLGLAGAAMAVLAGTLAQLGLRAWLAQAAAGVALPWRQVLPPSRRALSADLRSARDLLAAR